MIRHNLSKFNVWILRKVFKLAFSQGPHHYTNLVFVQKLILEQLQKEFFEDTEPTIRSMNRDAIEEASHELKRNIKV